MTTRSTSSTVTNTSLTTQQYDQRVGAADNGIAAGAGASVVVNQVPDNLSNNINNLIDLTYKAQLSAQQAQQDAIASAQARANTASADTSTIAGIQTQTVKIVLVGLAALAAILLIHRGGKNLV